MRKSILATALVAVLPFVGSAHAEETSPIVANVGLVSDYAYRGISQTDESLPSRAASTMHTTAASMSACGARTSPG